MIDENHPDYEEYKRKFWAFVKAEELEIEKLPKPKVYGWDGESNIVHKKYVRLIKALQKEYAHLFIQDENNGGIMKENCINEVAQ